MQAWLVMRFWKKITIGCKHGKVDQKNAPVSLNHSFCAETPKSSSNPMFKLKFSSWWPQLLC